jgi:phage tail-like protein
MKMAVSKEEMKMTYPIPTYRYRVTVGEDEMAFSGVSGLSIGVQTIEYKDGLGNWFQMPGQEEALTISLKRGIVVGQSQLYDWINSISHNQVEKKDISISLTNDAGTQLLVTWNVVDAFPTKLSAPNFDGSSNEVAIEELSLLARRMTIQFH